MGRVSVPSLSAEHPAAVSFRETLISVHPCVSSRDVQCSQKNVSSAV